MKIYKVGGMSCAACSARVEKAVSSVQRVSSCSVSLLTNTLSVEGDADDGEIEQAVVKAGYTIIKDSSDDVDLSKKEIISIKKRLIASLCFLIPLMYFSMGHTMWNFPVPWFLEGNHTAIGIVQLIFTLIVMVINRKFFISGTKAIIKRNPNMDTLVALGASAAFVYSSVMLTFTAWAQFSGDDTLAMKYMHEFYFESSAMILTLITVGKLLEAFSKGKTTNAIKSLINLSPKMATLIKDGKEVSVPASEVQIGDIFAVKPGENIPVDAIVISGESSVNESALTGESIPSDKKQDSSVWTGTTNLTGYIVCRATKVGNDTTLSKIIKTVTDAAATKAPIARIADKVSGIFVPVVIVIALVTIAVWLLCGKEIGYALARGISVLVISCPCALGLATPVAIMVGNGKAAKNGILFKNAESLEMTGKIEIAVFDKTGTITKCHPAVTDVIPADNITKEDLLKIACSLEIKSEHPFAKAIIDKSEEEEIKPYESDNFAVLSGSGVSANINEADVFGGNPSLIKEHCTLPQNVDDIYGKLATEGKTPLLFCSDSEYIGIIAVRDEIKPDSQKAIKELKGMGIETVMLTGDNERTANATANNVGIEKVISGVLPVSKKSAVDILKLDGMTAMTGDGINDAPALTAADVGIAIGAGTDIAIDAASVVLSDSKLTGMVRAVRISRATLRNIHENLFWAFIYNIIGIPLAAGVWIPIFGWELNPMFGAAAMSLSSFCVVTNALRLNFVNLDSTSRDRKIKRKKQTQKLTESVLVEGMMCGHCESRVQKALEKLDNVERAVANHESGMVTLSLLKPVSKEIIRNAIEKAGYKMIL